MHLIADLRRAEVEIKSLNSRLGTANQEKLYFESQIGELNKKVRYLENELSS
jgi:predicted  nucleic acid-binding Zn-ribbon protein